MSHIPFSGRIPTDRLYCPRTDMWLQIDDEVCLIGASAFGIYLAGEVIAFTAKPKGAVVARGRGLGTIECRKTVLAIHAPISLVLLEGNEAAEEQPGLLNNQPYGTWMIKAKPSAWLLERDGLMDAAAYRAHVLNIDPEATLLD